MGRRVIRHRYDAQMELSEPGQWGQTLVLRVKRTFSFDHLGRCRPGKAVPLSGDPRDLGHGPRLLPDCDFWPHRELTDVAVLGHACAPAGRPLRQMEVSVRVGAAHKRLAVFGRREIFWRDGQPRIGQAEPFVRMPLTREHAYGGIDWRVPVPGADDPITALRLQSDHPGLYPRNPFGKGYLVCHGEVRGMEMPNLEDPDQLLCDRTLVCGDPARWHRQPLPWSLDWTHPSTYPRSALFLDGVQPWFPCPDESKITEVKRGLISHKFFKEMHGRGIDEGPHPRFFQQASSGLSLAGLRGGEPVELRGMHPQRPLIQFNLPRAPTLNVAVDGAAQAVGSRLHSVAIRPEQGTVTLLHVATMALPRVFLPGIHRTIPVEASVDHHAPFSYTEQADTRPQQEVADARR